MCVVGTVHKLTIPASVIEDEAEYTVTVGADTSKAPLFVEGEYKISYLQSLGWFSLLFSWGSSELGEQFTSLLFSFKFYMDTFPIDVLC